MAALPLDPRTLNSWEDAFQYPLPVVRKLEQQLRQNIDENRQKLRSLVGASYRDLLGTAERIIGMDEQLQMVEKNLGDIGRKCNARAVERVGENHARMNEIRYGRDTEKHRAMAQTKVLQITLSVISRTIKAGGDSLLAAKLLVLARLLHKSVSDSSETPEVLDESRRRLNALRKRLLSYVERVLVRPTTDKSTMVNPLCAYALVTSSTPRDVLRHFLQARYEQLETNSEDVTPENIVAMIGLYSQTLSDTRELFPRRFADGLSGLGKTPLLRDAQVRATYELNLDIYDTWIAEDVRAFMPWLRHDHLTASEVTDGVSHWSRQVQACLVQALTECLEAQKDARAILKLRQEVLSMYLRMGSRAHSRQVIQDVREVFLGRLANLAVAATDVEGLFPASLYESNSASTGRGTWDLPEKDVDLSGGAFALRHAVIQRRHGHNDHLQAIIDKLDDWMEKTNQFWETIDEMRAIRWMHVLDDVDDVSEGEWPHGSLGRRDPDQLQKTLREANTAALKELYDKVRQRSTSSDDAASLVRLLRELDQRRSDLENRISLPEPRSNSDSVTRELHQSLANSVLAGPMQYYAVSAKKNSTVAVALWDGSPPLPVQPSPRTFKLLTSIHKAMTEQGADVWSPAAVSVVKIALSKRLSEQSSQDVGLHLDDKSMSNGHADANEEAPEDGAIIPSDEHKRENYHKDRMTQTLFDTIYLQRVTTFGASHDGSDNSLQLVIDSMRQKVTLDGHGYQRLQKSANEYWKRTYLLFGLLAPGSTRGL